MEPLLLDPTSETGNAGLRTDLLVFGNEGLPYCFLDMVFTCTAPSFASRAQPRRGTAAARKFQEKVYKYEQAVYSQLGSAGLRPDFVPLVWKTYGFFYPKSHSWLGKR